MMGGMLRLIARRSVPLSLVMLAFALQVFAQGAAPQVIFVCEHGAAKSLIATAYFNKLAAERGLPDRAAFRGVAPQDDLSVRAVAGLKADGLPIPTGRPTALDPADVVRATHVFAIGCVLPAAAQASGKAGSWDDVPDDQGYEPMRDAIIQHVRALVASLRP